MGQDEILKSPLLYMKMVKVVIGKLDRERRIIE